jgi:G:T/U-mismatch repair DNA glycosylase
MPLSRRQPETQDPYLVVARPTAALLDANNQITAEVPDSIRLLYKRPVRLDLSAESAVIQQCFSLTTNQRTVLSAQ